MEKYDIETGRRFMVQRPLGPIARLSRWFCRAKSMRSNSISGRLSFHRYCVQKTTDDVRFWFLWYQLQRFRPYCPPRNNFCRVLRPLGVKVLIWKCGDAHFGWKLFELKIFGEDPGTMPQLTGQTSIKVTGGPSTGHLVWFRSSRIWGWSSSRWLNRARGHL